MWMIFFLAKGAFSRLTKDEGTELVRKFLFSLSQIEHPHSTLLPPTAALTLACFGLAENTSAPLRPCLMHLYLPQSTCVEVEWNVI
jgi:hypothetical protein